MIAKISKPKFILLSFLFLFLVFSIPQESLASHWYCDTDNICKFRGMNPCPSGKTCYGTETECKTNEPSCSSVPGTSPCSWVDIGMGVSCPVPKVAIEPEGFCSGDAPSYNYRCCCPEDNVPSGAIVMPIPTADSEGLELRNILTSLLNSLLSGISKIFLLSITFIVSLALFVVTALSSLALFLLDHTLSSLINVPIIRADIVATMWGFVRDFANLFFLLFFVIIGLATILKIESYKFQKTLPLLVIMALLVNFSLLLVGLIVDMGNIMTSLFIDGVKNQGGTWNNLLGMSGNYFLGIGDIWNMEGGPGEVWTAGMGYLAYGAVLIVFFFAMACTFWVINFIFFWRIAILWTIAILAPLAFVSYIFDSTRKMIWERWFKALVQWAFIAVPILFFMVLGFAILNAAQPVIDITGGNPDIPSLVDNPEALRNPGDFQSFLVGLISVIITPIIALMMILLGIIVSMTFVPEGAQSAINASNKAGSYISRKTGSTLRHSAPGTAIERGIRQNLENTPLRGVVGGRGAYSQKLNKERQDAAKRTEGMTLDEREKRLSDKTIPSSQRDAEAANLFNERASQGKRINEKTYEDYANRAERGGADMDKVKAQNPTHRAKDNNDFKNLLGDLRSVEDFSRLTPDAFKFSNDDEKLRVVKIAEKITSLTEQQKRKVAEKMDSDTRNAFVTAFQNNSWEIICEGLANNRSHSNITAGINHINTHFGT